MKATFKSLQLSDTSIDQNRIDIWQYPIDTPFKGASELLNEDESARSARYYFDKHRRRFTTARAALRVILARYLQTTPQEIHFNYNEYGKPEVADSAIQFNLSHSGNLALLAIGKQWPLGIDIEFFSKRPYEGIGSHLFSPAENIALNNTHARLKPFVFFHIWAQKEAFIKACGLGLSYPTAEFDVPILSNHTEAIADPIHQKTWQIVSFMPQPACSAALCYHPDINEIRYSSLKDFDWIDAQP